MDEKLCAGSVKLLTYLRGTEYKKGRLYEVFDSYREDILKRSDTGFREAVYVIRSVLMIDPSNDTFMGFCIEKGLFYNLKQVIKCCKRSRDREIPEEFAEAFIKAAAGLSKRVLLGVLCQIADLLPGRFRRVLIEKIRLDPGSVDLKGIYYLLTDYCIRYDRQIAEYFLKKIEETDDLNEVSYDNPAYVILKLHEEGCIHSLCLYSEALGDKPIFRFATNPTGYDYDQFDPAWWKLISAADYGNTLRRPEGKALFFKLMDTDSPEFCPIKSMICSICPELAFERTRNLKNPDPIKFDF